MKKLLEKLFREIIIERPIFRPMCGPIFIFRHKTTKERFFDFLEDNIILLIIGIILIVAIIGLVIYLV